jgi:putative membrane protein
MLAYDTVQFLSQAFANGPVTGIVFSALTALVAGSALLWIGLEIRMLRRLERVDRARADFARHLGRGEPADMHGLITAVSAALGRRPAVRPWIEQYRHRVQDTHSGEEQAALFVRIVLRPVDREAYAMIARAARDVGIATTVVPTALADTVLMIWRGVRMMREIAELYGYRTGIAGTWHLLRSLAAGAALLAVTDVAGQVMAQQLGGALFDRLAGKLGSGLVGAGRMLRLGLLTMQLCRAVPFTEEDLPTLRRLIASLSSERAE